MHRWGVPVAAALVLALALSGCGGQDAGSAGTSASTDGQQTTQKPTVNSRGNIVKHIGDESGIYGSDGKDVVSWTVTDMVPDPHCTESYQAPIKNGHLVSLDIKVTTSPKLRGDGNDPFHIGSGSLWKYVQKDGTLWNGELLNEATVSCVPSSEMLPADIGPGVKAQGKVILDIPQVDGSLVFSPGDGEGWEYPLK